MKTHTNAVVQTVPAKAIGATPGLKELCYSITGGALAAQGQSDTIFLVGIG